MREVFVFRVEWMVNLECAGAFYQVSRHFDVSDEVAGITIRTCAFALHTNVGSRGFGGDSIHPGAGGADAFTANADVLPRDRIGCSMNADSIGTLAGSSNAGRLARITYS